MSSLSQNLAASGKISGSFQTGKVTGCIPPGPPRYRPPPQPQTQVKTQPAILAQDEKLYDPSSLMTSDHLKQFHTVSEFDRGQYIKVAEEANIATGHHKPALVQTNSQDMLKFVRKQEVDNSSRTMNEQLRKMSSEIRLLKETNQKLVDDNQELRDLCCFLDDDRQKGRKLAREWQRFGRYTASVMRQEVSAYQNKLRELDTKQQELIKDNLELKELCLYLDEERNGACRSCGAALRRDEGDGSSSSTNPDETTNIPPSFTTVSYHTYHNPQHSAEYVQQLEARVKELEDEKQCLINKGVLNQRNRVISPDFSNQWKLTNLEFHQRPEAVVQALQEQLEIGNGGSETDFCSEEMDEGERALLREMCNVVWRKLEEASQGCRN